MAPVDTSPASNMCDFELISSHKSNDIVPVHQYKSSNTGLTVFIAEVDGPVVMGHFVLVTEAHDDDGLPHTLEHLIFLGSESYPYKGILDLLANRSLASGTNAATDRDNTFYTLITAGSEGFLNLMPIYLDHILYPTLKKSAFITEVHHITPDGDDAGVVYCEKLSNENKGENLLFNEMTRKVYPGKCGYTSVTGGILQNLRESTSNEKVINYHKQYYRPENLYIIITGRVNHADVFKALKPVENKIMSKGNRGPFERPWQSPVPPLIENVDIDVLYPCDDEDYGLVYCAWQGPSVVNDYYDFNGCSLLLRFLSKTAVSPLQQEFTETDDPLASNIQYSLCENSIAVLILTFMNVPLKKIDDIKPRLLKVLNSIVSKPEEFDMKRLNSVINRHIQITLSNLETIPHNSIAYMIIGHILYSNTKEDLDIRLNNIDLFKKLLNEPASYWINLIKKYFIDNPMVFAKGIPSLKKKQELKEEEIKRLEEQIKSLGEKGLEQKRKELEDAIQENEREIPPECLKAVPIPSTDSISYHNIKSYSTGGSDQHPKFDLNKLPFYTYLNHVNTNYFYMFVIMDTSSLPKHHRFYLPLLLDYILECPVRRNGGVIPYQKVVSEIGTDTIGVTTRLGYMTLSRFNCGDYNYTANFLLQAEFSKYDKAVQWSRELLFNSEFTVDRLNVIASKMINDVAEAKRMEDLVCADLMKGLLYSDESNHYAVNMLRQHKFLTKLTERLSTTEGQKKVIDEIESVRKTLTSPGNFVTYIATNVDKLSMHVSNVYEPWEKHFPEYQNGINKSKIVITPDYKLLKEAIDIPFRGCVTGMGCATSGFMQHCTSSIKQYNHPDEAPLLVCLQYLSQMEGPMWKQIRGQGLSYGYRLTLNVNEGLLYLKFFSAKSLIGSFQQTKNIIEMILKDKKWDQLLFESGKSSLIYKIVAKQQSVSDLVKLSVYSYLKNVSYDYHRQLIKRISDVTIEDMDRCAQKYIKPLFDPEKSWITVVCPPLEKKEIADELKKMDYDLKVYDNLQETYLNDMKF